MGITKKQMKADTGQKSVYMSSQSAAIQLPGYECQLHEDSTLHSEMKVQSVAADLANFVGVDKSIISTFPSTHEETVHYRCSTTFQIIIVQSKDQHSGRVDKYLQYAMRTSHKAVALGGEYFPIATTRIQHVMKHIINKLNGRDEHHGDQYSYKKLKDNLASISFVSSWNNDGDCIVTMNFSKPIYGQSEGDDLDDLKSQGEMLCKHCHITTLILRSKKMKLVVGRDPPYIDDIINMGIDEDGQFQVFLDDARGNQNDKLQGMIPIYYKKPEDAFHHPNSNTMLKALFWMLNRLKFIADLEFENGHKRLHLLEMYCGCGAHTMAISKTGLFSAIIAVELDQRLVDACIENAIRNGAEANCNNDRDRYETKSMVPTPVFIYQGDASEWSRKVISKKGRCGMHVKKNTKEYWYSQDYHVLIVDPPRSGLGKQVCDLALQGSFEHIIYISCGKEALTRDIQTLKEAFSIVDCSVTDLFPRTSSVETLVHLKRRSSRQFKI